MATEVRIEGCRGARKVPRDDEQLVVAPRRREHEARHRLSTRPEHPRQLTHLDEQRSQVLPRAAFLVRP